MVRAQCHSSSDGIGDPEILQFRCDLSKSVVNRIVFREKPAHRSDGVDVIPPQPLIVCLLDWWPLEIHPWSMTSIVQPGVGGQWRSTTEFLLIFFLSGLCTKSRHLSRLRRFFILRPLPRADALG